MKRNRRIDRVRRERFWLFSPGFKTPDFVASPRSVVMLKSEAEGWPAEYAGVRFRIGYYRWRDGLDCVWLVNKEAKYFATVDQADILKDFEIIIQSDETDLYGRDREVLEPIA